MRVISYSLWGSEPRYTIGALRNAELAASVYPGWRCRFYCGSSVPTPIVAALRVFPHVDVVSMAEPGDWVATLWRFYPAGDADVSVMMSRDADSRLTARERAAVDAWLASDKDFHVMRDHPHHGTSILGGMWGVRGRLLHDMRALIDGYPRGNFYQVDQQFLDAVVAPRVRAHWIAHDEYYGGQRFPTRRVRREFVGQPFNERDEPLMLGPSLPSRAKRWLRNRVAAPT